MNNTLDSTNEQNSSNNEENRDYKDTLFLPKTNFSMKANLSNLEPEILQYWENINLRKLMKVSQHEQSFILHSGPPFANGRPHLGHVLNFILKDLICRYKLMNHHNVSFLWGWDCHGLPIEIKVEQEYKENKKDMSNIVQFRQSCRDFAQYWLNIQKNDLLKIGLMTDPNEYYSTMDYTSEASILEAFFEFIKKGVIYRDTKPVMWSISEKTAFAEAEIQYVDNHVSQACYVAFPLVGSINGIDNISIIIWTTTPWTLPCNRAIAYSKQIDYTIVECILAEEKRNIIVAKNLLNDIVSHLKTTKNKENTLWDLIDFKILCEIKGEELYQKECHHCLHANSEYNFTVPLLEANYVEENVGTGFVHTAPSHGIEDFLLCKQHNISAFDSVSDEGSFTKEVGIFCGQNIFNAIPDILEKINASSNLVFVHKITHSYPYSWRSNTPLIFRMTPQWFIKIDRCLKEKCLNELKKVNFTPSQSRNRISSMIDTRPDWCISRQRLWGIPLFMFVNKNTHIPLNDPNVMKNIIDHVKNNGVDICFSNQVFDFIKDKYPIDEYYIVSDVIDVWFESGATHKFVISEMICKNDNFMNQSKGVADLYIEGSDQHRGWFMSSLIESCVLFNQAPFKEILTHGFLMDQNGMKISKSKGNGLSVDELLQDSGADIIRLWAMLSEVTEDVKIGNEIIIRVKDVYRRLRNCLRYLIGSIHDISINEVVLYENLSLFEKYICHIIITTDRKIRNAFDNLDFRSAILMIHEFCADMSAKYLDLRKDCLYCDSRLSETRKGVRTVMMIMSNMLIKWLAPVIPFTCEDAWRHYRNAFSDDIKNLDLNKSYNHKIIDASFKEIHLESVHLTKFLELPLEWENDDINDAFQALFSIKELANQAIEQARNEKIITGGLSCALDIRLTKDIFTNFSQNIGISFCDFLGVSFCNISTTDLNANDIKVSQAEGRKCARCWKISKTTHDICNRCQNVVENTN